MRKMFIYIIALSLSSAISFAAVTFTSYAKAKSYIGNGKPVMLELGTRGCSGCKIMNAILGPYMKKHPRYQIFDILINEQPAAKKSALDLLGSRNTKTLEEKLRLNGYPYQIFYDKNGKEAYRHAGVLTEKQLDMICRKLGFR